MIPAVMIFFILTAAGCARKGKSEKIVTLNYANFAAPSTFVCVQMERWADEVEARTGGRVIINTFPDSTLLDAKEMFDGVVSGQADIGCLCMAYQPGRFPVTNAMALPFGIADAKTGSAALVDLFQTIGAPEFDDVKVLTMFTNAPANIQSSKPVRTFDDISTVTLRASGGAGASLKAWGVNMLGMPMSETPEALQKGLVDGLFSSLEVMKDYRFAEYCPYVTEVNGVLYPFAVVMNKDVYESLPSDIQKVFDDLFEEQSRWTAAYMDDHVKESMEWSKAEYGVEVFTLSDTDRQKLQEKNQEVISDWMLTTKEEGIDGEEIISRINSFLNK